MQRPEASNVGCERTMVLPGAVWRMAKDDLSIPLYGNGFVIQRDCPASVDGKMVLYRKQETGLAVKPRMQQADIIPIRKEQLSIVTVHEPESTGIVPFGLVVDIDSEGSPAIQQASQESMMGLVLSAALSSNQSVELPMVSICRKSDCC